MSPTCWANPCANALRVPLSSHKRVGEFAVNAFATSPARSGSFTWTHTSDQPVRAPASSNSRSEINPDVSVVFWLVNDADDFKIPRLPDLFARWRDQGDGVAIFHLKRFISEGHDGAVARIQECSFCASGNAYSDIS